MTDLIFYTRRGCGLCDRLRALMVEIIDDRPDLHVVDVDIDGGGDAGLVDQFGERIPAVMCGGRVLFEGRPEAALVREALDALESD